MRLECLLPRRSVAPRPLHLLAATALLAVLALAAAPPALGCYGVIVGRKASADGSVLVGHNEQDFGTRHLNFRRVPRRRFPEGATVRLQGGAEIPQVRETFAFLWSQCPGLAFSDTYLNEHGVAVASDGCSDREDSLGELEKRGQIVNGGVAYLLRRLVVERARTAREGVEVAGDVIARVGYAGSRTLIIADPREAWLFSMAKGKHWVAARVPDDEVALLPNTYIVGDVDLKDSDRFIACPDLVEYAVERGWYDPASGEPFNFQAVYAPPPRHEPRQWQGQLLVSGLDIERPEGQLPFSVKPRKPMTIPDVCGVLRNHEGVALCSDVTVEAAVFQLRADMPPAVGCVYWRTSAEPCASVLTPWYAGIRSVPAEYALPGDLETLLTPEHHFGPAAEAMHPRNDLAWWTFKRIQDHVNSDRARNLEPVRGYWDRFEAGLFARQPEVEAMALAMYGANPDWAAAYLTEYCASAARHAQVEAHRLLRRLDGVRGEGAADATETENAATAPAGGCPLPDSDAAALAAQP